jgi:hypothetical protein
MDTDGAQLKSWLVDTRKLLAQNFGDALKQADDALAEAVATEALRQLCLATKKPIEPRTLSELREVVADSHRLYRELQSQSSQYVIQMLPAMAHDQFQIFTPDKMDAYNEQDEGTGLGARYLILSVFPAILKLNKEVSNVGKDVSMA